MTKEFTLEQHNIEVTNILRNASPPILYEEALAYEPEAAISDVGALMVRSGEKTGRSPIDKRIVEHPDSKDNI
jgi:phosphoenolpyruvate carboxykinase (ATP)